MSFPGQVHARTVPHTQFAVCGVMADWLPYGHDDGQGGRVVAYTDGESNLQAWGDGYRFFPEQNHPDEYRDASGVVQPTGDHQLHDKLDLRLTISPAIPAGMSGTLHLKVFDPDNALTDGPADTIDDGDPDSFTDFLEKPDDNYPSAVGIDPVTAEVSLTAGQTRAEHTFSIPAGARRPGNNYVAAVHSNADFGGYRINDGDADTLRHRQITEDSGGSGGAEVSWPEVPGGLRTPRQAIWRTLWTELDSMLDPSTQNEPGKRGVFGPGQPEPDDVAFDPHDPDTSFLASQMARACVLVQSARPQYDARDGLEFWHNFPMSNSTAVTGGVRDVESENDFWSTHIVGVYEPDEAMDYDTEIAWHIGQANRPVIIYEEVVRDVAANYPGAQSESTIERRLVLHEVLHRFFGGHSSATMRQHNLTQTGVMRATDYFGTSTVLVGTDEENLLSRLQLGEIHKNEPDL